MIFRHKHKWDFIGTALNRFTWIDKSFAIRGYVCDCGKYKFEGSDMAEYDKLKSVYIAAGYTETTYPDGTVERKMH